MIVGTNIIIVFLNGRDEAKIFIESKLSEDLLLSVVTVSEVYAGIRDAKEIDKFEILLSLFEIIALNKQIAVEAGKLKKKIWSKSWNQASRRFYSCHSNYFPGSCRYS